MVGEAEPLLQLKREFSNAIERMSWRLASFTGNGEHVSAAVSTSNEHTIYIWTRDWGGLEAVLQGDAAILKYCLSECGESRLPENGCHWQHFETPQYNFEDCMLEVDRSMSNSSYAGRLSLSIHSQQVCLHGRYCCASAFDQEAA